MTIQVMKAHKVNSHKLLENIRKELGLSIAQFCFEMNWPSANYYDGIKSGIKRADGSKKPANPTINKIFEGINYAIATYPHWSEKKVEITAIVIKELIK